MRQTCFCIGPRSRRYCQKVKRGGPGRCKSQLVFLEMVHWFNRRDIALTRRRGGSWLMWIRFQGIGGALDPTALLQLKI